MQPKQDKEVHELLERPNLGQQAIDDALKAQGQDVEQLLRQRNFRRGEAENELSDYDPNASQRGFQAHPVKAVKVALEWRNLTYSVRVGRGKKAKTKTILDDVSGAVSPGHLLAIMGPTGSGKTSLVNALAGRLEGGVMTGSVLVNGRQRAKSFKNISGYVLQDDCLLGVLSVRETFTVAAQLRLPRSMSKEEKKTIVDAIITELGLGKAADTRIGNAFVRGVSGGERKRVAFGQALLGNPSVMFLDEPTSGLDAYQAQNVMEALWRLARGGRTVLSTIHQPRSSIYSMFDLLLLISEGKLIYFGPASAAVEHFGRCHMACPVHYNPADFFLDIASVDNRTPEAEAACHERIKVLSHVFERDRGAYAVKSNLPVEDMEGLPSKFQFATDWLTQYGILQRRALLQAKRSLFPIVLNFGQNIVIGLVLGIIYLNTNKSFQGTQNRAGLLFFVCIGVAFGNMLGVLNVFPAEKAMVFRERAAKSYRVSAYFVSKWIADQPLRISSLLVYTSIVYFMADLNRTAAAFFKFFVIVFLEAIVSGAFGLCISAAVKSVDAANALAPALLIILILFGGFYANAGLIPKAVSWIRYISHLFWAFSGLTINEFRGTTGYGCSPGSPPDCTLTGDQIANDQFGFGAREYWESVVALIGLSIFWNGMAYIILRTAVPSYLPLSPADEAAQRSRWRLRFGGRSSGSKTDVKAIEASRQKHEEV